MRINTIHKTAQSIEKIQVWLNLEGKRILVGDIQCHQNQFFFKLSDSYLSMFEAFESNQLLLSPFKMLHTSEIQVLPASPFEGLSGLFSDSLPDGWGKLLVDRFVRSNRIASTDFNLLHRLMYVGENGSGALEYEPVLDKLNSEIIAQDLEEFNQASKQLLSGEDTDLLGDFYRLGGTSGGARPKLTIGYNPSSNLISFLPNHFQNGYEPWIVKFRSNSDLVDAAYVEYAYYQMAKACGIEISDSILLKDKNNEHHFATKRFDRIGNQKIHLHSLAGLLHDDFRMSNLDYGHLMDAAFRLEKTKKVQEKIFRLAVFNVFACNQDDHTKNFSFLMDAGGTWKFAPAYDLTFSQGMNGFQSMSVGRVSKEISKSDLLKLASYFQIESAKEILDQVSETLINWQSFAKNSGVSNQTMKFINQVINNHIGRK